MDFIFEGFQPLLPVWLIVIIFAITISLVWWSYKEVSGIQNSHFYTLFLLRSTAFFVLFLLLLNPLFKTESTFTAPPSLLVMLDNSASTSLEKGNYRGVESYNQVLEVLDVSDTGSQVQEIVTFGNDIEPVPDYNLSFDDDQTDLSASIRAIQNKDQDITAAILVSDGIYTKGQNPVYELQGLSVPVYTVALGDTTTNKDLLVSSVTANSVGYINSHQSVTATVRSTGFEDESFEVRLQRGDEVLSSQTVTPEIAQEVTEVSFDLLLEAEGLQQYQVVIPELPEEWTPANNTQRFSIDVRDDRQQILSLAFEIHPDVKFIRTLTQQDQNIDVTSRTWIGGNRFMEGDLSLDPDTIDLTIIHGFPATGLPKDITKAVGELAEQSPLVLASTPNVNLQRFSQSILSLPITASSQWDFSPVVISPATDTGTDHPIMELPSVNYEQLPVISAPVQNLNLAPGASILFESLYQGQATKKPLVAVQELGNRRMAIFSGFNWYRLNQSPDPAPREFVRQLWLNTVSWTATSPDKQLLQIDSPKSSFSNTEPVTLNAQLTNERGETESQATIDITVSSDSMAQKFYSMENMGAGNYQLKIGTMPEGIYTFDATAKKGDRTIDTKSGEFSVARSNAEFLETRRNDQLLRQVAVRTGGSYTPFDSVAGFWEKLRKDNILEPTEEVETSVIYPNRHLAWFLLVLLLLTAEWSFRKYLSLP